MLPDAAVEEAAKRWNQYMRRGKFAEAWRESDFIASTGYQDPHRFWNGEDWNGKHVMLRCLHGLGDAIQFIRYAPLLRQTCRKLTVQSHPELTRLLALVPGVDHAVPWEQGEGEWDLQMEVNELPRIFRTEVHNIPPQVPYIFVTRDHAEWAAGIIPTLERLRVGLVWRASDWDRRRNLTASEIAPLLNVPACSFYVLQKNADAVVQAHDVQRVAEDVADTAALMTCLDLVISVDTMTAHLAGALGRPTWLLLPKEADWRWMEDRADSPWYPTMRLFRQETAGDWSAPMTAVLRQLQSLAPHLLT